RIKPYWLGGVNRFLSQSRSVALFSGSEPGGVGDGGVFQLNKYAYKTCIYTVVKMGFYYFLIK
ncbi:hypothetical protein AB6V67_22460, partial [Serratia marcescens]|uniref:hypothetical protein n=1 Tax=Serratia marcescens TaxID=615 RepID=UPI00345B7282